jgi:23S rRNA pseudouridine1911/1915/1917 synthase
MHDSTQCRVSPHVLQPPKGGTEGALEYPALVHRLDSSTSGLLVLAKTTQASIFLSNEFEQRQVRKTYTALLEGVPCHGEQIDYPIDSKPSVTIWKEHRRINTTKGVLTMVEFYPQTGRKHQLRKHASEVLQCPIVGDERYGSTLGRSLFLCANHIRIKHPVYDVWIEKSIELPKRFNEYITREETRYDRYQKYLETESLHSVDLF